MGDSLLATFGKGDDAKVGVGSDGVVNVLRLLAVWLYRRMLVITAEGDGGRRSADIPRWCSELRDGIWGMSVLAKTRALRHA